MMKALPVCRVKYNQIKQQLQFIIVFYSDFLLVIYCYLMNYHPLTQGSKNRRYE
jgi:hypothetical protein